MNEYEEKYKMFGLTEEVTNSLKNYSVSLGGIENTSDAFAIKTVVIDEAGDQIVVSTERQDAKLV